MSGDYDSLLAAVLESPDDDFPRLVLADWLESNGQEWRGRMIREQIELGTFPRDTFSNPRYHELLESEHLRHRGNDATGFLAEQFPGWIFFGEMGRFVWEYTARDEHDNSVIFAFDRGFVGSIRGEVAAVSLIQESAYRSNPLRNITYTMPEFAEPVRCEINRSGLPPHPWEAEYHFERSRLTRTFATRGQYLAFLKDPLPVTRPRMPDILAERIYGTDPAIRPTWHYRISNAPVV